jgi:hypothetical protein
VSDDISWRLLNDPAALAKDRAARAFLDRTIFADLRDLRPWFDSTEIKHFHADDFRTVIDRCTQHNVLLIGIEVFTPTAELETVEIAADNACSNEWCLALVDRFRDRPDLTYCATYDCEMAVE